MKILVTGSNGQLGKTITTKFEQNNWKVFGLDIHERSKNERLFFYISGRRHYFIDCYDWVYCPHA